MYTQNLNIEYLVNITKQNIISKSSMLKNDYFYRESTNRTFEHKRQKISDHTEHVQALKSQVNDIKNDHNNTYREEWLKRQES